MNILYAFLCFVGLGALFGVLLSVASRVFEVKTDPRVDQIKECLPGANCGGCGFSGCGDLAEKIVSGEAKPNACPVGGKETAEKIAEIMGVEAEAPVRMRAQVMCSGVHGLVVKKYIYEGEADCSAAAKLGCGDKMCPNGCVGLGSCVKHCRFDAIKIKNGVAVVDYEKCAGCGVCAAFCPKNLIKLVPFEAKYHVGCSSLDKGAVTRTYCDAGCIGCKLCEKACESGAITVSDNVAKIDYTKCTDCGKCAEKCPKKIIKKGKK